MLNFMIIYPMQILEMEKIKDKESEKYAKLKEADYRLLKYKDN